MGLPGSGKSSIGFNLSKILGYGFLDLDEAIEKESKTSIAKIFAKEGEAGFRKHELAALTRHQNILSHVISCGGGALETDEGLALLQSIGKIVWIDTPLAQIAYWLSSDEELLRARPLFNGLEFSDSEIEEKVFERLQTLMNAREARYRQASMRYENSYSTAEFAASILKKNLIAEKLLSMNSTFVPTRKWKK